MTARPMTVEGFRPLVEVMAAERTRTRPDLFDDAVQEGMIAVWRVLAERPEATRAYVSKAARRAVGDVLRGRPMTGEPRHQGSKDGSADVVPLFVDTEDGTMTTREPADHRAADALDALDVADAVREAVAGLDPVDRDVVFLRYWRDLGYQEIAPMVDRPAGTLSRRWTEIIRPELREALAPLAHAA